MLAESHSAKHYGRVLSRTAGFHSPHNTHQADVNTSSWGGSILRDEATGIWHMYSAEMIQHCGIGAWEPDR